MIPAFFVIGTVFLPLGIILLVSSNGVVEVSKDYTDACIPPVFGNGTSGTQVCPITLEVKEQMKAPVYVYYELTNYYQNHRRYVKSRNDAQLRGDPPTSESKLEDCTPRISSGGSSDPNSFFLPCGLIAWSRFNDTFSLRRPSTNAEVPWTKDGVAWESDLKEKFNNPPANSPGIRLTNPDGSILNFEDPDFVVWMRTAGLPHFRKLYRVINTDLNPGVYTMVIDSRFPVKQFEGTKSVVLSTTSWMGGKNSFLGLAYIIVGSLCFLLGTIFLIANIARPRNLGDQRYLVWQQ